MATSSIMAGDYPMPQVSDLQRSTPGSYYYQPPVLPPAPTRGLPASFMGFGSMPPAVAAPAGTPAGFEMPLAFAPPENQWFSFAPNQPAGPPGFGGRGGMAGRAGVSPSAAPAQATTLAGSPPVTGQGGNAFGGVPSIPNPLSSTDEAANYFNANIDKLFPNLDKTLAEINSWLGKGTSTPASVSGDVIAANQANMPAIQSTLQDIEPTIPATWDVIEANLGGHVTRPEINLMTQYGAERGTGTGFGVMSPNTETSVMAALGNLGYARQQRGVDQAQNFGQHLYGMARPFMVTPGEEAAAQADMSRAGVSAASQIGRDIFGAINNLGGDIQSARYAANVAAAAPNPEAVAREAERLRNAAALLEYQLALAAGNRSAQQPRQAPQQSGGGGPPQYVYYPKSQGGTVGAAKSRLAPIATPRASFTDPETGILMPSTWSGPGEPERVGEGTGEAYSGEGGLQYDPISGMMFDPVYGGYYDMVTDQWLDYPEQGMEMVGDFPMDFGSDYEYFA